MNLIKREYYHKVGCAEIEHMLPFRKIKLQMFKSLTADTTCEGERVNGLFSLLYLMLLETG